MSSGARTTTIARPQAATAARTRAERDSTLLGDLTRPISTDRQLVRHRGRRWLLSFVAVALMAALLAALFTFPLKNWRHQQDVIDAKQRELAVLTDANDQLAREVGRLRTADGALEAARDELGLVVPGEERISVLDPTDGQLALPSGWPYDVVAGIIATRTAPPVSAPTPSTPTPTTAAEPTTAP